jgi:hypothetical protein
MLSAGRLVQSSQMEVVASPEALDFVRQHGGRLYVWLQKAG